jgi:hypothetical protein
MAPLVIHNGLFIDDHLGVVSAFRTLPINLSQAIQVHTPNQVRLVFCQLWIEQCDMDSALECFVYHPHAVRGEKQDAGVIFKDAQEDCAVST